LAACTRSGRAKLDDGVLEMRERNHHRQPSVGSLGSKLDAFAIERGDPDWDVLTRRFKAKRETAAELEQFAVVVQRFARDQAMDELDVLAHPCQRRIERHAMEIAR